MCVISRCVRDVSGGRQIVFCKRVFNFSASCSHFRSSFHTQMRAHAHTHTVPGHAGKLVFGLLGGKQVT